MPGFKNTGRSVAIPPDPTDQDRAQAAFRTTKILVDVVITIAVLAASASDRLAANDAWFFRTIGCLVCRGLAKSGSATSQRRRQRGNTDASMRRR